ncbi:molybdopterin-dependent oxidoreductase [Pannonibacter phragmitetus]|uniref:molybdopterin-dependent oxidoreductase n=1 Tax=Pannonibacter phragmitetus TaxID=121719 RepID=UPI003D2F17FC
MRLLPAIFASVVFFISIIQGSSTVSAETAILTIDGNVPSGPISMSMNEIEALGLESMTTVTPWHDGVVTFEGVPFAKLMAHAGVKGGMVEVMALNSYFVQMPFEDVIQAKGLLATRQNGKYMPVADKGPLFLIFPFSDRPDLKTESYYSRAVWQIRQITIR